MRTLAFLACLCLAARADAASWQTNFVDNPSFELDATRDGLPDGWTAAAFRSPAKLAWDRTVARSGGASVRISNSANPKAAEWNQRTGRWVSAARRTVSPGKAYSLGVWIRTEGVTGGASACIAWWKGSHWLAESYTPRVRGTRDWQWAHVTAKAPPEADAAQVYLCLSDSGGSAWFDDVVMLPGERLPARCEPVDLAGVCNTGFRDDEAGDGRGGWTDQGRNDLRGLPTGGRVFRGVPFRVLAPAKDRQQVCIVLRGRTTPHCPKAVTIPLGRKCRTVYFLHACAWAPDKQRVGRYELAYDDGSTAAVALDSTRQLTDWWNCQETDLAAVAWEGRNPVREAVGLNLLPVANPHPAKTVRSIRAVSAGGDPVLMLVAVTTSDGPAVLTRRPVRYEFTDTAGWYPFNFPLDDTNLDGIDLTGFLDPPAGRHGFLTVRDDGHFYFADGTRARFFGTNVGGPSAMPEKRRAPIIAARLAKYGVNLLRIHAIDGTWGRLIDYSKGDSRHFDPVALDRLDCFFAELKKRGIYVYFDCLDYRRFLPGDGVRDAAKFQHGWHHSIKGATVFNDRLIELQKEFATSFYTHRNPYTNLRYVDDPAVAVVEITNENSAFYFRNPTLTLPSYVDELRTRWNRWLAERYGSRDKLAAAWTNAAGQCALLPGEDPARNTVHLPMRQLYQDPSQAAFVGRRSPVRVAAMVRFFFDLERRYYARMRAHLRGLGLRVPITGTNQTFCPASTYADACHEFMSRNNYWQHPNVRAKPFVTFRNVAVVRSDLAARANPVAEIASSTVAGKPMISPEFNFPWPNEYRAECLPLMAAYACLQDWDGMLFFSYHPERKLLEHFGNQSDPVRWGQFPAAAMIFHRRDVAAARHTVHVAWSKEDVFAGGPSHSRRRVSPFRYLPYLCKVRNGYFDTVYEGDADAVVAGAHAPAAAYAKARRAIVPAAPGEAVDARRFLERAKAWHLLRDARLPDRANRFTSDTGELTLDAGRGVFTIAAPQTRAAVGFLAEAGEIDLRGVTIRCETPFAAVMVTSLDGRPIGQAKRLLVTAVARAENTGQAFSRNRSAIPAKGRPPVLAEPVRCRVVVPMPARAAARALDETGRRRDKLPAAFEAGRLRLRTDAARSPWLELAAE